MHCAAARYIPPSYRYDPQPMTPPEPTEPAPSQAATDAHPPVSAVARFPSFTFAMLCVFVAVFAAELVFGVEPMKGLLEPSVQTLLALGGLQYTAAVGSDEWYRMFLAPLMHASLAHLLFNAVALYFAGRVLEPMIGARWFAVLFVVSGLAGASMSLALNDHDIVSVGASGAIMGLFAAIAVLSYRFANPVRAQLRIAALQVLVASMLPAASASLAKIDYGAHLGGAMAGAGAAVLLLALWPKTAARPRLTLVGRPDLPA
jgi:rhomboid protease GluP